MNVINKASISIVVPGVPRLDASQADGFRSTLKDAMATGSLSLVLDLDSVNLVDSTILGVVVGVYRDLPEDGRLVLCAVSENVKALLHLTHLDRILKMYTTREEAVADLTS